jgi:glucoside 3-dehydrogenase (cytochrome c) hitch-hiker subunit
MNRRDLIKIGASVAATSTHAQPPAAFSPKFFDAHQNETVIALTDLIIPATDTPGAKAARVNEWIDKFFADGRVDERSRFLEGLGSLDAIALNKHGMPFTRCAKQQQIAILTDLDKSNDRFFRQAKSMTSRIYYATSIGYQELNKGGRVPSSFGCKHPEHA